MNLRWLAQQLNESHGEGLPELVEDVLIKKTPSYRRKKQLLLAFVNNVNIADEIHIRTTIEQMHNQRILSYPKKGMDLISADILKSSFLPLGKGFEELIRYDKQRLQTPENAFNLLKTFLESSYLFSERNFKSTLKTLYQSSEALHNSEGADQVWKVVLENANKDDVLLSCFELSFLGLSIRANLNKTDDLLSLVPLPLYGVLEKVSHVPAWVFIMAAHHSTTAHAITPFLEEKQSLRDLPINERIVGESQSWGSFLLDHKMTTNSSIYGLVEDLDRIGYDFRSRLNNRERAIDIIHKGSAGLIHKDKDWVENWLQSEELDDVLIKSQEKSNKPSPPSVMNRF